MDSNKKIKTGRLTTLVSFILGTGIFGLYFLTSAFGLLFLGYGFIALTGLINLYVLGTIIHSAIKDKENRIRLFTTGGLMLLNIPVMLTYCWIAIILLNTMRITFTNATDNVLTDINIIGCETKRIYKLEKGESKTVWVGITGDCSINIDYLKNGERKEENVAGYVTNSIGQKMKHNIGGLNDNIF
jgi:hypothetical protein